MTKQDALKILKKNPDKWFTPTEVSKLIGNSKSNAATNLSKLHKDGDLLKSGEGKFNGFKYKYIK